MAKAIFMAGLAAAVVLDAEEAQYWLWSQHLDWGYATKPPGIAWEIAATTSLFGNTEFGVRFGAIILGILLPLAVYHLARSCGTQENSACLAALLFAFTPVGIAASLFATTDAGYVLFWILAFALFCKSLRDGKEPNYPLMGFYVLCGALFKWTVYLFWPLLGVLLLLYPGQYSWRFWLAIAISLLGLLPSLYWNIDHGWSTFKHVGEQSFQFQTSLLAFGGAQIVLLTLPLVIAWLIALREELTPPLRACSLAALIPLTLYLAASVFLRLNGNWCVFALPPIFVLVAWYLVERLQRPLAWTLAILAFTVISFIGVWTVHPPRSDWRTIAMRLFNEGYNPSRHFLFSDRYQTASLLSFYGPVQQQAYVLPLKPRRTNQFDYWPPMDEQLAGRTGFFVGDYRSVEEREQVATELKKYFQTVEHQSDDAAIPREKQLFILKCSGYNPNRKQTRFAANLDTLDQIALVNYVLFLGVYDANPAEAGLGNGPTCTYPVDVHYLEPFGSFF
jgi:hypothetical protein